MAAKKKAKTNKNGNVEKYFAISSEKKKKIIGILLILFSVILLLSIISYSRFDKADLNYKFSDMFRVFGSNSDFIHKADTTHNWLGIFGAYISDFFINSTLGVFSSVFPLIFFLWGISFIHKINFRRLINYTNFLLITGIILSTFFGVLLNHYKVLTGV
jgi:S-DNA-T family DNA segregation ATPase FtsK/SpoIIIE